MRRKLKDFSGPNLATQFGLDCQPQDLSKSYLPTDQECESWMKWLKDLHEKREAERQKEREDTYEDSEDSPGEYSGPELNMDDSSKDMSMLNGLFRTSKDFAIKVRSRDLDPKFYLPYYGSKIRYLNQDEKEELKSDYNKLIKDRSDLVKGHPQKYHADLKDMLTFAPLGLSAAVLTASGVGPLVASSLAPIAASNIAAKSAALASYSAVTTPMLLSSQNARSAGKLADKGAYHLVPKEVAREIDKLDKDYHKKVKNTLNLAKDRYKNNKHSSDMSMLNGLFR